MKRSKASKGLAEKIIAAAIADGTAQVQGELAKAKARIALLEGLLTRIAQMANTAKPAPVAFTPPPQALPPAPEEEPGPPAPSVPLADEDELGEGRWA